MADNKLNQEQMYALLQFVSKKMNTTPAALAAMLQNGGFDRLMAQMSPENAQKLQGMMGDRERAQQLLQSPQAQALIQKLLGNK